LPASLNVPFVSAPLSGRPLTYGVPLLATLVLIAQPRAFAVALAAAVVFGADRPLGNEHLVHAERTFFGLHRIDDNGEFRALSHGTTTHGVQSTRADRQCTPLTYYTRSGPVGQLFESFSGPYAKRRVASIGLGTGSLAAYAEPGQAWTFFEINP